MTIVQDITRIEKVIRENQLAPTSAQRLIEVFAPAFARADELVNAAKAITVTSVDQKAEMKAARDLRLKLREIRTTAEKARKELKEDSLRTGKAIDGVNNVLKFLIEPEEERLQHCEEFAERAEAKRKADLQQARSGILREYADPSQFQLGEMTEEAWQSLLVGMKAAKAQREEEARRAQAEREEADRKRREEDERIRKENEKLRAEAAQREKVAAAERAKAEAARKAAEAKAAKERADMQAKLEAERKARERAEAAAKVFQQDEDRKAKDLEKARKKAAAAPDAEKLRAFAAWLRTAPVPEMKTDDGRSALAQVRGGLRVLIDVVDEQAGKLGGGA